MSNRGDYRKIFHSISHSATVPAIPSIFNSYPLAMHIVSSGMQVRCGVGARQTSGRDLIRADRGSLISSSLSFGLYVCTAVNMAFTLKIHPRGERISLFSARFCI